MECRISPADSLLPDGKGGFWLGGQTGLVHWHDGVSETYPIKALNSNAGQQGVVSLARGPDGTLWVGILAEGPGLGLGRLIEGIAKPFVTPTFDGSKVVVNAMLFDRDGNLWVGTVGKGALSNSWQRGGPFSPHVMGCPVILYLLFSKTEKGSYGL